MNDRRRAYALATLTAAYFVMGTTTMAAIGALPSIADGLHVSRGAVANLIAVFALTYAVSAPLIQMVLGALERRALLLGGLSLATLGALLAAAAPSYGALFAARVLTALGAAAIGPVASALGAGLVERHQQGRALAAVFMGMTLSSVLSMPAKPTEKSDTGAAGVGRGALERLPGRALGRLRRGLDGDDRLDGVLQIHQAEDPTVL